MSDVLDKRAAAAHLGITEGTLKALRFNRDGAAGFPEPAGQVGNALYWTRAQLDAWRAEHPARAASTETQETTAP